MSDPSERTFSADFKRFFVRGLVVLLPSVLTLWIVVYAYQFVDSTIAEPINHGIRLGMYERAAVLAAAAQRVQSDGRLRWIRLLPQRATSIRAMPFSPSCATPTSRHGGRSHWYMNLIGLVVAIVAVYVAGRLLGGYLGRQHLSQLERLITSRADLQAGVPVGEAGRGFPLRGRQAARSSAAW